MGSVYEWDRIKTKEFELFAPGCDYTDDSVCTAAVAYILLDELPSAAQVLRQWCRDHPHRGYGGLFLSWIYNDKMEPYNSYGNGAAMRVLPAAFLNRNQSLEEALASADRVTEITHNHPEGIKGARATTHTICLPSRNTGRSTYAEPSNANTDTIFQELLMTSAPTMTLMRSARKLFPKPSLAHLNQQVLKTPCGTRSRSEETAIHWRQ